MYVLMFFLSAVAQYVLNTWSYKLFTWIPELDICANDDEWCVGALSAARVAFAFSVFHLILALLMIRVKNSSDFRASIQDGYWLIKIAVVIGLTVVAYFIPTPFFVVFGWICLFGAAVFILIQLMLLIELAYSWADNWLAKYEEGESKIWYWLLLLSTIGMYAVCITATVLIFVFFYKGEECWLNILFPTINLAMCLVLSLISINPRIQEAHANGTGLLQSAVVSVYATYLIWSAVTSEPNEDGKECNPFDQVGSSLSTLLLGACFTLAAVCFTTIRTATQGNNLLGGGDAESAESKLLVSTTTQGDDAEEVEDDEVEEVSYNYTFFHITFLAGTMFIYMLVTDWATVSGSSGDNYKVDHGMVAVWVKVVSSWLVGLLYAWTLFVPLLFPNRDFS